MNRNKIKAYAPQARRDFIRAVTDRAALYGLTKEKIQPVVEQGDVALIAGRPYPRSVAALRKRLKERVAHEGFDHVMEAMAYTWFNRLVAIRYMELHGYLDHGFRVLSHPEGRNTPQILDHAEEVDLPGLKRETVIDLKLAGNREAELYRKLLIAQCNALHDAMPFLFERIDDETELLLPDNLLQTDSIVRTLVAGIDEENWQEVEIIGWLYEAYISERYEAVIGSVVASADIPAATQRFTPKWIVRYLVQNTLGRLWLATYPQSPLKGQMKYYIEPAEQTPEVQEQLRAITPTNLNPEEITFLDPACGSAHILVEAYEVFKAIYQERGYRARDIPRLILSKNLFGLEIDDRAAQLAAFALMMKARADDRRLFDQKVQPHVRALIQTDDMDAEDIAAALNVQASKETPPPGALFETEDNLFTRAASAASASQVVSLNDVKAIVNLFEHAKTFGSLIQVTKGLGSRLPQIEERCREVAGLTSEIASRTAATFQPVVEQARMLSDRYDCVVANPPYMGSKYCTSRLKEFISNSYNAAKADLCTCFVERGNLFTKPNGMMGQITMQSWMFLASFEGFRQRLLTRYSVLTMLHLGPHVFPSIGGEIVQTAAFVCTGRSQGFLSTFFRLTQGDTNTKHALFINRSNCFPGVAQDELCAIPGSPLAYWVSSGIRRSFAAFPPLSSIGVTRKGMVTADNARNVRYWFEVGLSSIRFGALSREEGLRSGCRWFPYNKGGKYRRWYGNIEHVVNWKNDGSDLQTIRHPTEDRVLATNFNLDFIFRSSLTWSDLGSKNIAFRYVPPGCLFDASGLSVFFSHEEVMLGAACMLNAKPVTLFADLLNPTMHLQAGDCGRIPVPLDLNAHTLREVAQTAIGVAREDWDDLEVSWDFQTHPLIKSASVNIKSSSDKSDSLRLKRVEAMKQLEEENNRLFIDAFGLQDELSPEILDEQITLNRPDREDDIKRLISYAIGCTMGRYSLDKPGLVYAHGGNVGFDPSQYKTFPADPHGIVPITETAWFADDATSRFVEFLGEAWPKEHLEKNLKFVADSLGPANGEQPRATVRRYFATGFYKHHLQTYKRRPIYWLFSSGKQRAFQCLVYLHRYHEGTLSRMRTEYVIALQGMIASRIDQLAGDIAAATSTAQRKKLERERETLLKQQAELHAYDEKLRHYADKKIALDLDDGVKVNYGKFGDLLAEVRAVTGSTEE